MKTLQELIYKRLKRCSELARELEKMLAMSDSNRAEVYGTEGPEIVVSELLVEIERGIVEIGG